MKDLILDQVRGTRADYLEIRIEESRTTSVNYQGPKLETVQDNMSFGGSIRALVKGGWGFVAFNRLHDIPQKVEAAIQQAEIIGRESVEKSRLAEVPVVEDVVYANPIVDPRTISLPRKVDLLGKYNEMILSHHKEIVSTNVRYFDRGTKIYFGNSEGTYIEQEKLDMGSNMAAIAQRNGDTQMAMFGVGTTRDYNIIVNREEAVEEACRSAVEMLDAEPVKGGAYTLIADQVLSGVFVHEAFGHLSEGDNVYESEKYQDLMTIGKKFGEKHLNVYDSGLDVGYRGYLKYDDEGVATEKTYLIREGELVGRLHSRETAGKMDERPTGNARAMSFRFAPICRMRNTCIENGEATFDEMLSDIKLGVYAKKSRGGQTDGEMFTFIAGEAWMIRDGKLAERVKNVALQGNVFETLRNIDMLGNDFRIKDSAGGCGKGGQMPLPVSHGSPHARIQNVVIGGQ
ncbi:MAG: TldD/PmbA family protein [Planctomycetota bacterium]|jgi:TldD protein